MSEIYIHIPFCNSKCLYCDFLSGRADESIHVKLVDAMCRELVYRKDVFKDNITSIFIAYFPKIALIELSAPPDTAFSAVSSKVSLRFLLPCSILRVMSTPFSSI